MKVTLGPDMSITVVVIYDSEAYRTSKTFRGETELHPRDEHDRRRTRKCSYNTSRVYKSVRRTWSHFFFVTMPTVSMAWKKAIFYLKITYLALASSSQRGYMKSFHWHIFILVCPIKRNWDIFNLWYWWGNIKSLKSKIFRKNVEHSAMKLQYLPIYFNVGAHKWVVIVYVTPWHRG